MSLRARHALPWAAEKTFDSQRHARRFAGHMLGLGHFWLPPSVGKSTITCVHGWVGAAVDAALEERTFSWLEVPSASCLPTGSAVEPPALGCFWTTFQGSGSAVIAVNMLGMGSGGGVINTICWIVLGIDEVTSATWCVCFGDDILDIPAAALCALCVQAMGQPEDKWL